MKSKELDLLLRSLVVLLKKGEVETVIKLMEETYLNKEKDKE